MLKRGWSWLGFVVLLLGLGTPLLAQAAPAAVVRRAAQTDGRFVVWLENADNPGATRLLAARIQNGTSLGPTQLISEKFSHPLNQTNFDLIGGGIVAWTEQRGNKTVVLMRDLNVARSSPVAIANVAGNVSVPSVATGRIVWREGNAIRRYDVLSGKATTVYTGPTDEYISEPQISGGWIVWATQPLGQSNASPYAATVWYVGIGSTKVKELDTSACGQVCFYHLSGNRVLYPYMEQAFKVRDLASGAVFSDDGMSGLNWDRVDGNYVYDAQRPQAYHLGEKRLIDLPFVPTDVRDGWLVGIADDQSIRIARMSAIERSK